MKLLYLVISAIVMLGCGRDSRNSEIPQEPPVIIETTEQFDARMEWWRDAGFGMFIHWGPYAIPAGTYDGQRIPGVGEWIMNTASIPVAEYEKYSSAFNPVEYDADEWVRIAKEAGMKYIVITSKHHDGFCLWDSKVTNYDVMDFAPIKRDLLAELNQACKDNDIKLCFYHSIMDWHHPQAQAPHYPTYNTGDKSNPAFPEYYQNYLKPQVRELIENYDPSVMWFDGEWIPEFTHEQGLDLYAFVRGLKPDIIVNNRVDKGRQGMQGMNKEGDNYAGDFGTPEQEILEGQSDFDWESCMTMNDTWGYVSYDDNWKSAQTLIHNIVDITAKGGNYLLNVGPTAQGLIPQASVDRLSEIGEWMKVNGEIVYDSRSLKNYKEGSDIYYVTNKSGGVVYVVATSWPGEGLVFKEWQPSAGDKVELLGYGKLDWKSRADGTEISIPGSLQDLNNRPCKYAWVFKFTKS